MPEAVIVSTARSPIGRACKGSMTSIRPDDLTAQIVRAALDKVPPWTRTTSRTWCWAAASPAASRVQHGPRGGDLLGWTTCPGPPSPGTAPRRCRRPGWRSTRSRPARATCSSRRVSRRSRASPRAPPTAGRTPEPAVRRGRGPHGQGRRRRRAGVARPARGRQDPGRLHRHGPDRRERGLIKDVSREDMDHFGVRSQNLAEQALANGFWAKDITPVTLPTAPWSPRTTAPAPASPSRRSRRCKPVFRPDGTGDRRQLLPAQRRRRGGGDHVRHKAGELGLTPLARIVSTGVTAPLAGDHGPRPGRGL